LLKLNNLVRRIVNWQNTLAYKLTKFLINNLKTFAPLP